MTGKAKGNFPFQSAKLFRKQKGGKTVATRIQTLQWGGK
jgi:hypothetical protein